MRPGIAATQPLTIGFILSTRRAGSTWLGAVLGSHTGVAGLGEYFRPFANRAHVACRLCEANGHPDCLVLHGIERVPLEDAYVFAAERLSKSILVDCSKLLDWPLQFARPGVSLRLIHLVRHPCGYIESESRRRPGVPSETLVTEWVEQNGHIEEFIRTSGHPGYLASYDLLADEPQHQFPALCRFLGFTYEPQALQYWNFEHHGLGANGANSLYLRDRKIKRYITGDDAYYHDAARLSHRADTRWKDRLPAEARDQALASPYVRTMGHRLGIRW